jgi:YjbE family integral membrane protein
MDVLFSSEFLSALLAIVVIDLVLAGDNAIVIALAARNLPAHLQKKAIVWGTVGAIVVRSLMTVAVVWLLKIPGLMLAGGALLVWIAYKLLTDDGGGDEQHGAVSTTFLGAMKTIVIADAVMGLDNVLAVAGAAQGSYLLVVLGLLISIPIVIWGSTLILKWVERYPAIVFLGAAVLAWTAVKMMTSEPLVQDVLASNGWITPLAFVAIIGGVLGAGWRVQRARQAPRDGLDSAAPVSSTADATAPVHAAATPPAYASYGDLNMEKILVPIDGSPDADNALRHVIAQFLANPAKEIHVLNVQPSLSQHIARFAGSRERAAWHREQADQALTGARALLSQHGVPHAVHLKTGDAAQVIAQEAKRLKCHRIVMGTARTNPLTRAVQDSTTSRLIDSAPVPVEVVAGQAASRLQRWGIPAAAGGLIALLLAAVD